MKRLFGPIAALLIFATLVGLGLWQLDRREWKQGIIDAADAGLAAEPMPLQGPPGADMAWRRVEATGNWVQDSLVRIHPATLSGRVGADYAAPFQLASGGFIVVELGWGPDSVDPPVLPEGPQTLLGALKPAPQDTMFRPRNIPPYQWLWLEPSAVLAAFDIPAANASPLVLRLATPPMDAMQVRPARPSFPNNHLQYAFTWFGLAAAWAVVAFLQLRGRKSAPASETA